MTTTRRSPLARRLHYWRMRQDFERGLTTVAQLVREEGLSRSMVEYILARAEPPDIYGLDEATALRADAAGVPPRVAAHLIATHTTATPEAQANALDMTRGCVNCYRHLLYKVGVLDRRTAFTTQRMQSPEAERGLRLIRRGYRVEAAAQRTGRSRATLFARARREHGGVLALRTAAGLLDQRAVERVMGVHHPAIHRWIAQGYLPLQASHTTTSGTRRYIAVARADLFAFVRERRAWMTYDPSRITDGELRAFAEQQRERADGRWWDGAELGRATGYTADGIGRRIRKGWVQAETVKYGMTWYIWVPDGADLRALIGGVR